MHGLLLCFRQALIDGKASPFHPLCGGPSCYIDRYTIGSSLAGKAVTITPLEPRGCRYVEVHVLHDDDPELLSQVKLIGCTALYRSYAAYHEDPLGGVSAADPIWKQIWQIGSDSTRSCCEDVCIDGPCRERGQWLGDTAAVTLPNLVYMYDDISPIRLVLVQTAVTADADGVFSMNCPNGGIAADYALLWFVALEVFLQSSGDS
jgi:hypothetical protein